MLNFSVDEKRCVRCGQCARECPTQVIKQEGKDLPMIPPVREQRCLQCQHCLAVCPKAAISILGVDPDRSLPLKPGCFPGFEAMNLMARGRRSIRRYKDENVDPALVRRLLAALAHAPTGGNRRKLTYRLVDDKAVMQKIRERFLVVMGKAYDEGLIPDSFVYIKRAIPAFRERGEDHIFRTAPHALVVSCEPDASCPAEDVIVSLAYFELLAQSAGLGTCWWGMLRAIVEKFPELKPLFGVPDGHPYYGMLFGTPDIRFPRTVQREDAARLVRITG